MHYVLTDLILGLPTVNRK